MATFFNEGGGIVKAFKWAGKTIGRAFGLLTHSDDLGGGLQVDHINQNNWPGNNPAKPPVGTEWRGQPGSEPGSSQGNYYNPDTGESYRPDLNHIEPIGSHWDYRAPDGRWYRIYPDGRIEPK